jgi:F0F1-type ATP synthase assembly protein I
MKSSSSSNSSSGYYQFCLGSEKAFLMFCLFFVLQLSTQAHRKSRNPGAFYAHTKGDLSSRCLMIVAVMYMMIMDIHG